MNEPAFNAVSPASTFGEWAAPAKVESASKARAEAGSEAKNRSLQGLRGFAALLVLLFHVQMMGAKGEFWAPLSQSSWFMETGPIAVRLFFFISGYLIVGSLWRNGDVKRFFVNRVLRIYPLFGLLHLIMFSVGPFANYEWAGGVPGDSMGRLLHDPLAWLGHFFSNLFFLPGFFALPITQQNSWSLAYEGLFYIVAGLMFVAYSRMQSSRLAQVAWWLGWVGVAGMCMIDREWCFFVMGVAVWWWQRNGKLEIRSFGPLDIIALATGFVLFAQREWVASAIVLTVFFIFVVIQKGWSAPILGSGPMNFFGKISYSLYLTHPFALEVLRRSLHHGDAHGALVQGAPWLFWIVGPAAAIVVAWCSYVVVEKHLTRWLSGLINTR